MYGVTESEKLYILPRDALLHGVNDGQRDEILKDYAQVNVLILRTMLFFSEPQIHPVCWIIISES